MEWLRDPAWQFIGAIIGVIAIVVTYIVSKRQQKIKSIAYEIFSNTSLLNVNSEIKNKMQVFFSQKPIDNLSLLILRIQNSGSEPILPIDYERPISIKFEDAAEILEVESVDTSPNDLQPHIELSTPTIYLHPILLNEKDYITLKILLTNFDDKVAVSGRIAGVRQVLSIGASRLTYRSSFLFDLIRISFFSFGLTAMAFFSILFFTDKEYVISVVYLAIFLLTLLQVIMEIRNIIIKINDLLKK